MKTVVLFSGGLDSTVCLALARQRGDVTPVFVTYGQRNGLEEERAVTDVLSYYGLMPVLRTIALPRFFTKGVVTSKGSLANAEDTVVPFRNGVFIALAASIAEATDASVVSIGAYNEPGAAFEYPDETPNFLNAMGNGVFYGTTNHVRLNYPLAGLTKADVIKKGLDLGAPLHLTRTCFERDDLSCGTCWSCRKRLAAFHELGIPDPISYVKGGE